MRQRPPSPSRSAAALAAAADAVAAASAAAAAVADPPAPAVRPAASADAAATADRPGTRRRRSGRVMPLAGRRVGRAPLWPALRTGIPLVLADCVALGGATAFVEVLHRAVAGAPASFLFAAPLPSLLVLLAGSRLLALAPGTALSPVQELRRLLVLGALLGLCILPLAPSAGAAVAVVAWLLAFVGGSFALRSHLRNQLARTTWWGERAIVVGTRATAVRTQQMLALYRRQGLQPCATVLVHDDDRSAMAVASRALVAAALHRATWTVVTPEVAVRWRAVDRLLWSLARPHALLLTALPGGGRGLQRLPLPLLGYDGRVATNGSLQPAAAALRRVLDAAVAALLLLLFLPLLGAAALSLRARQRRVLDGEWLLGRDGALFRSLLLASPPAHWTRRWHLHVLPRLWNVLRGDLALFGPQALSMSTAERHGAFQPFHLAVRPGLLGLAQLGAAAGASHDELVRLDVEQATGGSSVLDCAIAVQTAFTALAE